MQLQSVGAWGTGARGVHGHNKLGPSVHDKGHTCAQLCMCMGHWWPILHVHVAPTSKCACAMGMFKTINQKSPEPPILGPETLSWNAGTQNNKSNA